MSNSLSAIAGGLAVCLLTTLAGAQPASTNEPVVATNSPAASTAPSTNAYADTLAVPSRETNAPDVTTNSLTETNAARADGFEQFALIADRNIFNASRRPQVKSGGGTPPPRPKIDVIALAGTLEYDQGDYAFFDSNATEYRKAAKVGDNIAGYQLKDIEQSHVALARGNDVTQLKVGEQLRREAGGEWRVTSGEPFGSASFSGPGSQPDGKPEAGRENADSKTNNSGSASEGPSEALKRLLEKARKERSK